MAGLADTRVHPVEQRSDDIAPAPRLEIVIPESINKYREPAAPVKPESKGWSLADLRPPAMGTSMSTELGTSDPNDAGFSAAINAPAPAQSVLQDRAMPAPDRLAQTGGAPLTPEAVKEATRTMAGMTPEQRRGAEALPGAYGTLAKAINRQIELRQGSAVDTALGGSTIEGRAKFYTDQGLDGEAAATMASRDIQAGAPARNLAKATPLPDAGSEAVAEGRAEGNALQKYSVGTRGIVSGVEGLKQGGLGVAAAALRLAGDHETAAELEQSAFKSKAKTDAMNELTAMRRRAQEAGTIASGPGIMDATYLEDMATGGVASAAQNIPGMAAGAATTLATKNPALGANVAMGLMTTQAFGSSFIDGRQRGYTPGRAAAYAGAMSAFEYVGERYGLIPAAMNAFRAKAKNMPLAEIPAFMERFIASAEQKGLFSKSAGGLVREQLGEQVGEQITGAGQYLIEGSALGQDKPMSVRDFISNAVDTSVQTLIATGMLQTGGRAIRGIMPGGQGQETPSAPALGADQSTTSAGGFPQGSGTVAPNSGTEQPISGPNPQESGTNQPVGVSNAAPAAMNSVAQEDAVPASELLGAVEPDTPARQDLEEAAHTAATSPINDTPEPTDAQKKAGNYQKGHIKLHGLEIAIENPRGSERSGTGPDGVAWSNTLDSHYGYFNRTKGNDGDQVDTFIGPNPDSQKVYVVDQTNEDGSFDEHKVLLGFDSQEQADRGYHANYHEGWTGRGAITEMPLDEFKAWVKDGKKTQPLGDITTAQAAPTDPGAAPDTAATEMQPNTGDSAVQAGAAQQSDNALDATESIASEANKPDTPTYFGKNNAPISEGGKPFKTNKAATDARKLQPHLRVVAVDGGFALTEKTQKQIAAQEKAAKRLRTAGASPAGEPIPAHAFIADSGGLQAAAMSDAGFDRNVKVRTKWLFGATGKGLTVEEATAKLTEAGYLRPGASHSEALDVIRKSITNPQYNAEGWERIAQAETEQRMQEAQDLQEEGVQEAADHVTELSDDELAFIDDLDADIPDIFATGEVMTEQDADRAFGVLPYEDTETLSTNDAGPNQGSEVAGQTETGRAPPSGGPRDGEAVRATTTGTKLNGKRTQQVSGRSPTIDGRGRSTQEQPAQSEYPNGIEERGNVYDGSPSAQGKAGQAIQRSDGGGNTADQRPSGNAPVDSTQTPAPAGVSVSEADTGLTAPTRAEVLAQQQAKEDAEKARVKADKAAEAKAKREADQKDIDARQQASADNFQLGQDMNDALSGQTDIFSASFSEGKPEVKPVAQTKPAQTATNLGADKDAQAKAAAQKRATDALAGIANLLSKNTRSNITPEEEKQLMPLLTELLSAAFDLGHLQFKAAARWALDQIRGIAGDTVADMISLDHLQGAYIGMAGGKQGADTKRAVIDVESKAEIESFEPKADNPTQETQDVPSTTPSLERDSPVAGVEPAVGDPVSADQLRGADKGTGQAGKTAGSQGRGRKDNPGLSADGPTVVGVGGDQQFPGGVRGAEPAQFTAGVDDGERSGDSGITGVPPESIPASTVSQTANPGSAAAAQRAADSVKFALGLENVRATLPYLLPGQQEDVHKAETTFAKPTGYGMLFTNGTGTGKTFSGLGVAKRFQRQGKTNILIVVPDDKIASDWIDSGRALGLDITKLKDTTDAGKGIVITSYANLGANDALARRQWDLVLPDEAHSLMQDKDGTVTTYLHNLRAITYHPSSAYTRHSMLNRSDIEKASMLEGEIAELEKVAQNPNAPAAERMAAKDKADGLTEDVARLRKKLAAALEASKADVKAKQGAGRTRLLALSATPFAYEKTIDWANGYLFDYNDGRQSEEGTFRGYNEGSNREQFFMQHLGYQMRYNKLTAPSDPKLDRGVLQRQFNGMLKKAGTLSGRMLDVNHDYDRRFISVESAVGNQIDEALDWLSENSRGKGTEAMRAVNDHIAKTFDYLSRRYLLEAIKATESVPIVKQHLALGRKVVVFHDYKKGGGFNPFNIQAESIQTGDGMRPADVRAAVTQFRSKFKSLVEMPFSQMESPIETYKKAFPDVLLVNGDEKKADLLARYKKFQDDATGPTVMLVQSAKNKGWSGHDTTGKYQRVLLNLGQPTQPTLSIQQEGRVYRTGQASDAIFRYMNTGTNWERWAFATTIATRASTAENLGMGELSRALKDSYISAFEESDAYPPGHEGEGTGGKARDKASNEAITEWDRAKSFYRATQKKNAKTKAQEGTDYFATPEPVGLKMVEWLDARGGESTMEPSGGHGAIARWLPENTNRTVIEPSLNLRSRMAMVLTGDNVKVVDSTFEEYSVVNKYDGIAMNPPFGSGGRTAIDHLAKAATHLRNGGRVVALIPTGPAADKKFDKWFYEKSERPVKPLTTHPSYGAIYRGDTVTSRASFIPNASTGVVIDSVRDGIAQTKVTSDGRSYLTAITPESITGVKATGARTEEYSPAANLHLVADIKLPQVTFERAGTSVATRIVVIEKQTDSAKAPNTGNTQNRDLSSIDNINDLFDRLENMQLPGRVNVQAAEEVAPPAPAPVAKPAKAAPAAPAATVPQGDYKLITITTKAGKELRGVIRPDLSVAQAKAIDPYTWVPNIDGKKAAGPFIREKYLKADDFDAPVNARAQDDLLTDYDRAEALQKQEAEEAARAAEAASKTAKAPAGRPVTADQVDMFNEQGSLFARGGADGKSSVLSKDGKFKGWPKFNAWTRAEYYDVVSLLPKEYRDDSYRREPLSAEDRGAHTAAALLEIKALNEGIDGDRGFGVDGLGNLVADMRDNIRISDLRTAAEIADKHGLGVFVTGVRTGSMPGLIEAGYVAEMGLGGILARVTGTNAPVRPMASGVVNNPAYGTMMAYKPRGFAMPMFARGASDGRMTVAKTQDVVDALTANWDNAPRVRVVASAADLPVDAPSDARGLYHRSTVWIVADAHRGPEQVARTYAHEAIAHHGLREILGRDDWHKLMHQIQLAIAMGNKPIREISAYIRKTYVDEEGRFNLNANLEADEITARVVELAIDPATGHFRPGFGFVKEAYAKLAQWLRDVVGLKIPFTMAELHGMLVSAQQNLKTGTRTQGGGQTVVVAAAREGDALARRPASEVAPVSRDPAKTPLYEALRQLARFDDAFQLERSAAKDLGTIATEMQAGQRLGDAQFVADKGTALHQGNRKKVITLRMQSEDGSGAKLLDIFEYDTPRPFVVIGNSELGQQVGGAKAYQIAFAWAHNNGKTMRPDPAGLTVINRLRRTEAMISSALRYGTTEHLEPHHDQYIALTRRALTTQTEAEDTHYSGNPELYDELTALKGRLWTPGNEPGNIASNVQHLIEASAQLAVIREPKIRAFEVVDGKLRKRGVAGDISVSDHPLNDLSGEASIAGVVLQPGRSGVGSSTLKRYAVSASVGREIQRRNSGAVGSNTQDSGVVGTGQTALQAIRATVGHLDGSAYPQELARVLYARGAPTGELRPSTAPIDTLLRIFGGSLAARITSPTYAWLARTLDAITPEGLKAGFVSDYGLREEYLDRKQSMKTAQRQHARQLGDVIDGLQQLDRQQSRVAYFWMQEKPDTDAETALTDQLPEGSRATLEALKARIDDLGQEAVRLGLISADTIERNRMAYLHRSYKRYETEDGSKVKAARSKAIKILGDQFKGRGLRDDVAMDRIAATDWYKRKTQQGKADVSLNGKMFQRLERRDTPDKLTPDMHGSRTDKLGKLREVMYWPADEAIPRHLADWRNDGQWEARFFDKSGKVGMWRDFTLEERTAMGEIQEVRYGVAKTIMQMSRDVETARFLDWIAKQESKADESLLPPDANPLESASMNLLVTYGKNDWVQVPNSAIPGTAGLKRYGNLAGRWVPGPVWNDLRQISSVSDQDVISRVYGPMLRAWKVSKTALSPATHTNNVMANFVMADAHDIQAKHMLAAMRVYSSHKTNPVTKALLEAFQDNGGDAGMFNAEEIKNEIFEPLLQQLEDNLKAEGNSPTALMMASHVFTLLRAGEFRQAFAMMGETRTAKVAGVPFKRLIKLYGQEDEFFRLAAFIKAREDGLSDQEAGKFARESFLNYEINAPWIAALRKSALPFIAFTYRAAPMMAKIAAERPWKLAKWMMVAGGLNALGYLLSGGDEDKERAFMPDEKSGRIWGIVPKLVRMPWNDAYGQPVFLDIRRWIPVGDVVDTGQSHSAVPIPPPLMPGGPMVMMGEVIGNTSLFTGQDITKATDTLAEKWGKVAGYLWKGAMPNIPGLPGSYSSDSIVNAGRGKTDNFGREQSVGQALSSSVGVKLASYPPDVLMSNEGRKMAAEIGELRRGLRSDARQLGKKGMTQEDFDQRAKDTREKIVERSGEFDKKKKQAAGLADVRR